MKPLDELSKNELVREVQRLRDRRNTALAYERLRHLTVIIQSLINVGGLVLIGYFVYRSVDALAGLETKADIGVGFNLLANIKFAVISAWVLGIGGIVYGRRQRQLRVEVTQRLQERNTKLELRLDPRRSSSGLTPRGETRPEDRP